MRDTGLCRIFCARRERAAIRGAGGHVAMGAAPRGIAGCRSVGRFALGGPSPRGRRRPVRACSSGTAPPIRPCTAADAAVTLSVGQYVSIDPGPVSGCSVFPATAALAAEYLIVPQLTSGIPGQTAAFRLKGDTILPAPSAPVQPAAELSPAERFHTYLRF